MKNLLVYLNPRKDFDDLYHRYVKIQIDNSLIYFKPEDILIVTNFKYKYHGIKTIVVPHELICDFDEKACKVNVIIYLLSKKILTELTWYHDFEAFQGSLFDDLKLEKDLGLTDYGWKPKWNTGSFFFKPGALDIFEGLKEEVYKYQANEEPILWNMYRSNSNNINSRCQKLNITYNIGMRNVEDNILIANKPIKVWHFHPYRHGLFTRLRPMLPPDLVQLMERET